MTLRDIEAMTDTELEEWHELIQATADNLSELMADELILETIEERKQR